MVEVVPDNYFPPEEGNTDGLPSSPGGEAETAFVGGGLYRFPWVFPTSFVRLFNLSTTPNETLLASVNAVRALMEGDKLEAACRLAEEHNLDISLTGVNTTLLVDTVNNLLNILVAPVYTFVLSNLNGHLMGFLSAEMPTLYSNTSSSDRNSVLSTHINATDMTNTQLGYTTGEVISRTLSFLGMLVVSEVQKGSPEMVMFLVCVGLCILLCGVRFRFAKYFRGIDMYHSQELHASPVAVPEPQQGSKEGTNVEGPVLWLSREGRESPPEQPGLPFLLDQDDVDTCLSPLKVSVTM